MAAQGISDAISNLDSLKAKADADQQALATAQSQVANLTPQAAASKAALDQGRQQLEALLDAYYTVGGALPTPAPAPNPNPPSGSSASGGSSPHPAAA